MEELGKRLVWHYVPFTDIELPMGGINVVTVGNSLLAMFLLLCGFLYVRRRMAAVPGRGQMVVELVLNGFRDLLEPTVGPKNKAFAQRALPVVVSLFVVILVSNAIVLIPGLFIEEPTGDLNMTIALALISLTYALYSGVRIRGVLGVLSEFCGPMFHQPGLGGKLSAGFFFPLHTVEEISRVISLSCRLFGNIMGSIIVITIMSNLSYFLVVPIALYGVLVVFEAALQAFVFASLTIVYISTAVNPD